MKKIFILQNSFVSFGLDASKIYQPDKYQLHLIAALHSIDALNNSNITIVLTGDEEDSGKPTSISRKPLFDAAKSSDIALDFEWAITSDTATIARRGIAHWILEVQGNEAYSSEIFQKSAGYGAIYEKQKGHIKGHIWTLPCNATNYRPKFFDSVFRNRQNFVIH